MNADQAIAKPETATALKCNKSSEFGDSYIKS